MQKWRGILLMVLLVQGASSGAAAPYSERTPTGILLNKPWKTKLYDFARKNVAHPAWGLPHAERNYQMTMELARRSSIVIDEDVLFAAAFFHDIGGLAPFERKGVDHAARSVEVAAPLLREWGFPGEKWPAVSEMILGHIYYGPVPESPQARAFRDADVLDFLGAIGIARILSVTMEDQTKPSELKGPVATLREFSKTMPSACQLPACRELANPRLIQLRAFLNALGEQSFNGLAL